VAQGRQLATEVHALLERHIVCRFSALGTDLRDVLTQDFSRENGAG
jgi:hypothetical protein